MALPPPYPEIYERLMAGTVIPFLGAGAPLFDRNPTKTSWFGRQKGKEVISFLPTAGELARYLADRTQLPPEERGELTKMAQYFEAAVGPAPLREKLREIFSFSQPPTPLHEFLADVPEPLLIVTTNYDDLMERAYLARNKPFDVVVHVTDDANLHWWRHGEAAPKAVLAEQLDIDVETRSVIYKIHGAIDRRANEVGHYVITENDYVDFLTRMTQAIPDIFAEPFQERPFLFLGYGLYDWNLRVILNGIHKVSGRKYRSWAIETLVKPVERKLWEARGVDVYDGLTLDQFLTELKKQGDDAAAGGAGV